jgi:hypothetical protein
VGRRKASLLAAPGPSSTEQGARSRRGRRAALARGAGLVRRELAAHRSLVALVRARGNAGVLVLLVRIRGPFPLIRVGGRPARLVAQIDEGT